MARFFVNSNQIKDNQIEIKGQDVRHIRDVLRLAPNSKITICDGKGIDYLSLVTEIKKDQILARVIERSPTRSEAKTRVTLFQSLIKGDKFEWVIQKAVEIGVDRIIPIETAHCVVKMNGSRKEAGKLARWNKIAQSAAKQSKRGIIPLISSPISYAEAIKLGLEMDMSYIAYVKEKSVNLRSSLKQGHGKTIGILIGPEGGFSKEEISLAEKANIQAITLGPRILRSETAALVSLSNILYECGEMEL